jgi:hypothetical protein
MVARWSHEYRAMVVRNILKLDWTMVTRWSNVYLDDPRAMVGRVFLSTSNLDVEIELFMP